VQILKPLVSQVFSASKLRTAVSLACAFGLLKLLYDGFSATRSKFDKFESPLDEKIENPGHISAINDTIARTTSFNTKRALHSCITLDDAPRLALIGGSIVLLVLHYCDTNRPGVFSSLYAALKQVSQKGIAASAASLKPLQRSLLAPSKLKKAALCGIMPGTIGALYYGFTSKPCQNCWEDKNRYCWTQ
jgi:hypothetical protein